MTPMPSRNRIKSYETNAYYHVYNRGVEKRTIFQDEQDYAVFLSYLKNYLLPKDKLKLQKQLADPKIPFKEKDKLINLIRLNNFADSLDLLAFCLMPNHFHLLIKQYDEKAIHQFMNSLGTRYSAYFNKRNSRVGPLYQGVYKAVMVESDEQLLHLSRYIHRNPIKLLRPAQKLADYRFSSYRQYLGLINYKWMKVGEILNFFSKSNPRATYRYFVEGYKGDDKLIEALTLE